MMRRKQISGFIMSIMMLLTMIPMLSFGAELPFTDVSDTAWYYSDVKNAWETGLIDGMDAITFAPDSNMTYAQAVKLAACMNQRYTTGSVSLQNGSPEWYDSYVTYAKDHSIISKDYEWSAPATRAGYVEIFAGALPDTALSAKNSIADGYIPDITMVHPQAAAIYKLYRAGVLTGTDEIGTFAPDSRIKRSEVSAILTRMMNESARKDLKLGPADTPEIPDVTYLISFDSNGGSAVNTQIVKKKEKATKPNAPTREGYDFAGWYSDSKLIVEYDFSVAVTENLTLYAKWIEKGTTGTITDSWDDIIASVNNGSYKEKYKIGDTKSLNLGSVGNVEMQIAAFDADELADGSGKASITWISKQLLSTGRRMNPVCTNDSSDSTKYVEGTGSVGGWGYTEMRTWLKESVRPSMTATIRDAIKPVTKYSNITDTSGTVLNNVSSTEDIWIPSAKEVGFTNGESMGPAYTKLFGSNTDRMKQASGATGSSWWWLRTACASYIFGNVNSDGSSGYASANHAGSVVFGFCM